MAVTAALSPGNLPQSSTRQFEVSKVLVCLQRRHDDLRQFLGGGNR
jgi:hypothetical protein